MSAKKPAPQAPPKDGGIMRFFTVTPKKPAASGSSSTSATPNASASASGVAASSASPSGPLTTPQKKADPISIPSVATPARTTSPIPRSSSPFACRKSPPLSPAKQSSPMKTPARAKPPTKSPLKTYVDDEEAKDGTASSSSSSSESSEESSASESSGSSSDDYSSDSSSSSESSESSDDGEDSEDGAPQRKKRAPPAKKGAKKSSARALPDSDDDEDEKDNRKGKDASSVMSPPKKSNPAPVTLSGIDAFRAGQSAPPKAVSTVSSSSTASSGSNAAAAKLFAAATADGSDEDDDDGDDSAPKHAALASADYSFPAFAQGAARRDAQGRRPTDDGYDSRTLRIPEQDLKKMTPAQRQYWEIKAQNMDVVLFFKMGKFYELFDFDAEVGIRELNLARMSGDRLHVGFPESAYAKYAEVLVKKGYKVGRVEQTQTPKQLQEANAKAAKGQKSSVVRREMCSILTQATIVDQELIGRDDAVYLLSLCEVPLHGGADEAGAAASRDGTSETFARAAFVAEDVMVGVCFTDTATGVFNVGSFTDDRQRTRLRTLLACIKPAEVLISRGGLSPASEGALKAELPAGALRTVIAPGTEFWEATRTIAQLNAGKYFEEARVKREKDVQKNLPPLVAEDGWPFLLVALRRQLETGAPLPQDLAAAPAGTEGVAGDVLDRNKIAAGVLFSALGGCTWYLKRLLLDNELLSLGNFRRYDPAVQAEFDSLVLDGQTLSNLEILHNQDGGSDGTLLKHLNQSITPFGKRLMGQWVARPLGRVAAINERLDAVEELMAARETVSAARGSMKKLPDLERMLARVRANGTKKDNAVMYENIGKAKIELFINTLQGFGGAIAAIKALAQVPWKSSRLRALTHTRTAEHPEGIFPEIETLLNDFNGTFNHAQARKDGFIVPQAGFVEEYDQAKKDVTAAEAELETYLGEVREQLRDKSIVYYHRAREVYQIEVPLATAKSSRLPNEFEQMSQTQKVRRYWTPTIRTLVAELEAAQERREAVLQDVTRQVFAKFGLDYPLWAQAVACVAELDCLISLALVSSYQDGASCRPHFLTYAETGGKATLELRDAVHPSLAQSGASLGAYAHAPTQFIPNDTDLGTEVNSSRFVLVSGPNMGGKSTLLRQVCCAVIMAQIGCYVSARSCRLTPVDRIFTRVGANDRIMQGQSTFLVELEETANILRHASPRSLVILDELGRGTSTFDGTSIAHAVIEHLASKTQCLTLFSTHYHMLLEEFRHDPRVSMYHMACQVRARGAAPAGAPGAAASASAAATTAAVEDGDNIDVTFLYKFIPGVCSKSFGMNVATLAGLPRPLVVRAKAMSELFEEKLALAHKLPSADAAAAAAASSTGAANGVKDGSAGLAALARRLAAALQSKDKEELASVRAQAQAALAH